MEGSGQSGAPANMREALAEHWVLTASLWEDGSDGRGFGPSPPTEWGPSPWEQEIPLWHAFSWRQLEVCGRCPGHSTPRLESLLGEQELL